MAWLLAYDIADDRLRLRAAEKAQYFGLMRMQKSVFVGRPSRRALTHLCQWLDDELKPNLQTDDKVLLLRVSTRALAEAQWLLEAPPEWDFLCDPPSVVII